MIKINRQTILYRAMFGFGYSMLRNKPSLSSRIPHPLVVEIASKMKKSGN